MELAERVGLTRRPLITVLMAVHNGERFLRPAVESILGQTLGEFEFLIVDDASTDSSSTILQSYDDARIRVLRNSENLGLTKSLNLGLTKARGRYVARMDADDIAVLTRFEKQAEHLRSADLAMTCSNVFFIDSNGDATGRSERAFDRNSILWHLIFDGYLPHPTLMWDREQVRDIVGGYDERFVTAQDYDFTWRVANALHVEGIEEPLLFYRMHGANVTSQKRESQRELAVAESRRRIRALLGPSMLTDFEMGLLRELFLWENSEDWETQRFIEIVPHYLELWHKFLLSRNQLQWEQRTPGLKHATQDDAAKFIAFLLTRREPGAAIKCLKLVSSELAVPAGSIYEAAKTRARARKARQN
jgi:glycosyltransferase involved in cell wall biosynthesis